MRVLEYLIGLRPAIPMSTERPCTVTSNSELRRWIKDGSVIINGERVKIDQEIEPGDVDSLVFFPKSDKKRTTLL